LGVDVSGALKSGEEASRSLSELSICMVTVPEGLMTPKRPLMGVLWVHLGMLTRRRQARSPE
jgi:hypothetical protein